jgi:hypothetical protein
MDHKWSKIVVLDQICSPDERFLKKVGYLLEVPKFAAGTYRTLLIFNPYREQSLCQSFQYLFNFSHLRIPAESLWGITEAFLSHSHSLLRSLMRLYSSFARPIIFWFYKAPYPFASTNINNS